MRNFADLIARLGVEEFLTGYHDRRWEHLGGEPGRVADLMSWETLNELLNMRIWTARTMQLTLDRQRVPPEAYCRTGVDRSHHQAMMPEPAQVMEWLGRGASLTLNEIETLHGPIRDIVAILEATLGAKSSANLYCSWRSHQAFDSHYDRHDVFALHVLGEKVWNVYRGRAEHPIEHPAFHSIPQDEYDRMKGPVAERVTMRPGDLLYLPRGQFHDALAHSGASMHVTFSCSEPIGLDWLNLMWQRALMDPAFRRYLPRVGPAAGERDLQAHIEALLQRLQALALDPETMAQLKQLRTQFGMSKPEFDLPQFRSRRRDG